MLRVQSVRPLNNFRLAVSFEDGTMGEVDLSNRLFGPVFEPLKDPQFFAEVFVDEFGAVAWPNGADLAPDAMYEQLRESANAATSANSPTN
jgi:hypothetical protein